MADVASQLNDEQMAELAALADGTLPADRRPAVEAWVAASPELQELVDRQRRAVVATQAAASEPVPASLRSAVDDLVGRRAPRERTRQLLPRLAFGGAVAAAATVALVLVIGGGAAGPTVADAAALTTRPPTGPAPAPLPGSRTKLGAAVEGVRFPNFLRAYGWRAVGVRRGTVDGRDATVVYYRKGQRRIAYAIVSGSGLPEPSGARSTTRRGVQYEAFRAAGRPAVTWRRVGHTCVLVGSASRGELLALASWRGGGTLSY
jgi:anti-sigma factor RsiW